MTTILNTLHSLSQRFLAEFVLTLLIALVALTASSVARISAITLGTVGPTLFAAGLIATHAAAKNRRRRLEQNPSLSEQDDNTRAE